jgi:transcriptional regulator with XRE-family HTH domain
VSILKELIKERKLKGISQPKVADYIGISKQLMSRMERGESIPNMNWIEKYAEFLGYEIRLLNNNK